MTPTVRLVDGILVIDWPDPAPASFEIASDLFRVLVDELNVHRRARRGLVDMLRALVATATTAADTLDAGMVSTPPPRPNVLSSVADGA